MVDPRNIDCPHCRAVPPDDLEGDDRWDWMDKHLDIHEAEVNANIRGMETKHIDITSLGIENPECFDERYNSLQKKVPTPADLFRAWQEGGEEKLAEMLPDLPDERK